MILYLKKIAFSIVAYTIGVDYYSQKKLNKMKKIEVNDNYIKNINYADYIKKIPKSKVVENIDHRIIWNNLCNKNNFKNIKSGNYSFVYRNYVNFEEKWAIASRRSFLHYFLFHIKKPTSLMLYENNSAILQDIFYIFNMKFTVNWNGYYNNNTIFWKNSVINSKYINVIKPKIVEQQRNDVWNITNNGMFLIINKNLVFLEDLIKIS